MLSRVGVSFGLLLAGAASVAVAETDMSGSLSVTSSYADNITLRPPGEESVSGMVIDVKPALSFTHSTPRLRSALSYSLGSYYYFEDDDLNSTYHHADASTLWTAIPEWFSVAAAAGYDQHLVDPRRAAASDRLFSGNNLADAVTASVTPRLHHMFGGVRFDASYTYGEIAYKDDISTFGSTDPLALDDSTNKTAYVSLASGREDEWQRFGWQAFYRQEISDYDLAERYEYERAGLLTSFGVVPGFSLIAEGGVESDLIVDASAGGLDESFYRGGIRWQPDSRTSLELLAGRRFFGTTVSARAVRNMRRFQLSLGYTEEPTTEGRQILRRNAEPGVPVEPQPGIVLTRATAEPFVAKQLDGSVRLTGRITTIYARVEMIEEEYLRTELSEKVLGAAIGVTRRLGSRTTLDVAAWTAISDFRDGSEGTDNDARISLERQLSRSLWLAFTTRYVDRWGSGLSDYRAWSTALSIRKTFGTSAPAFDDVALR